MTTTKNLISFKHSIFATYCVLFFSEIALGGIHLGVSGSATTNSLGLETHREQSGKGSIGIDLGSYFRISFSALREHEAKEGYTLSSEEPDAQILQFQTDDYLNIYAIDLIAVLYAGELLTPFVFLGAAWKFYDTTTEKSNGEATHDQNKLGPVPNYGGGLSVSLNRDFSLKFTYTMSPGVVYDLETKEMKQVRDVRTEIGLSYRLI